MPEGRFIQLYDEAGNPAGRKPWFVSDADLVEQAEIAEARRMLTVLDRDWTTTEAVLILKTLIKRLLRKGLLP